ncbi:MAG: portal protein [Thiotrichaceae bacterium]
MPKFSQKQTDEIIGSFVADFDLASTAENEDRIDMIDDLRFAALDQWPVEVRKERKNRPMLTLDHIGQSIRKVVGNMRQNMPSIKVDPIDDGADKETASVLEDLTRQIEQSSNARNAYMKAGTFQVKCGYGVFRVNTVENTDDIFVQDIVINPVKNPFTYYFDPDAIKPQKQDGRFMIVSETMSRKKFKDEFSKDIDGLPIDIPGNSIGGTGENRERWYSDDSVRIGEYFVRSKKTKSITQLSNGVVVDTDAITDQDISLYQQQGITPVRERKVKADVLNWYKLTSFKILEHKEWPSKLFPGIPVYGEEENIEGKTWHRGIVRAAKDPQRMYNYWNSAAAETIALQPKAPFLVTKDQIKNSTEFWNQANTANLPYLPYEPDGKAPPPQRMAPPIMQNGMLQQAAVSAQDIQQATGVFEASTGQLPEQRSGIAVEALQREADLGSSLFMDNLAGAIEHCGRIIIDLIPTYYDTQRVVRLRGEDDAVNFVEINKPMLTPDGLKIQNDLTRGKYDVRVGVGPSYRTKRIEAASSMVELARVFPQILEVAGDLVAKNLDWPGADEISKRLKKLLPPGIAEMDDDDPAAQQAAEAQQQQQQLQQAQLKLAMDEQQGKIENTAADTANKKATSIKNLTEAQQNDFENAINTAELAQREGDVELKTQALNEILQLMSGQTQGVANAV